MTRLLYLLLLSCFAFTLGCTTPIKKSSDLTYSHSYSSVGVTTETSRSTEILKENADSVITITIRDTVTQIQKIYRPGREIVKVDTAWQTIEHTVAIRDTVHEKQIVKENNELPFWQKFLIGVGLFATGLCVAWAYNKFT